MLLWCRSKLDGPVPPLAPHCFPWPLCLAKVNMHVCALRLCEQPEQSGDGQRGDEQPEQSGDEQPEPHQSGDGQWQQPEQWWWQGGSLGSLGIRVVSSLGSRVVMGSLGQVAMASVKSVVGGEECPQRWALEVYKGSYAHRNPRH